MKRYKLILWVLLGFLSMENSYARICLNTQCGYLIIIDKVCKHNYNPEEIAALEESADQGDSYAQLVLGILYDIKSVQRHEQASHTYRIANWWHQRKSPCDPTNNEP
ncbi:hypothetical protein PT286_01850 [Neisseriaceae bacterium ESL0693]|nr:hypothetical protein [Neisseriaceae bacterium ESL0693]